MPFTCCHFWPLPNAARSTRVQIIQTCGARRLPAKGRRLLPGLPKYQPPARPWLPPHVAAGSLEGWGDLHYPLCTVLQG